MTTFFVGQKLEPGMFPVVEDIYSIDTKAERKWFIVRSRGASEGRAAASIVDRLDFESYCPQEKRWGKRDRNNRPKRLVRSLLPGYLFVRMPERGAFAAVRECDAVGGFLDYLGKPVSIPDEWVADLRDREERGQFDKTRRRKDVRADKGPFPDWVFLGALVKIDDGPFAGFLGKVCEASKLGRLKLETTLFGRISSVELELAQVRQLC